MRALALLVVAAASAGAQAPSGFVVKAQDGAVYLDLGEGSGAAPGRAFEVFREGSELKHPVTGKSLGRVETTVARGTIREVKAQYSVGSLAPGSEPVEAGMKARLSALAAPPQAAAAPAPQGPGLRAPRWKSPPFDFKATAMALGDLRGDGRPLLALCDEKTVRVFAYPPEKAEPLASRTLGGTGSRILSAEAQDADGDGREELLVSYYHGTFERVETAVLSLDGAELKEAGGFPWLVRGYRDGEGRLRVAVQQLSDDETFPFSGIYPLSCEGGRCGRGKDPLKLNRVDFLFDFTLADLGEGPAAQVSLAPNNRLRLRIGRKTWRGREAFGQSPQRLRWPRGSSRLLEFHPRIEVGYGPEGRAGLYLVRNLSALGSLSEPFGFFNAGELHRWAWDGTSLVPDWKAELGGYAPAIALVGEPGRPRELAVAVVGAADRSSLWIYDP